MKQILTKHIDGVWISDGTKVYPPKRYGSFPCITEPLTDDSEQTQGSVRVMTTTHEQIRITKHDDYYRATIYVGDRLSMYAEGDTQESARLSLLDRIITEDGEDIKLSGPIVHDLIAHANQRAKTAMVTTVREAWSAIRHSDNATNIHAGFGAIETAAQIVYGGVDVDTSFIDGWPSLSMILRMVCDAYRPKNETEWNDPQLSSMHRRLSQMLFGCIQ